MLYADYISGVLLRDDFAQILDVIISYLFRRVVCHIPTNSLNKIFTTLALSIIPNRYVESASGRLLTLPEYRRFPSDEEFEEALKVTDFYHMQRRTYFFRKIENHGRKEEVSIGGYTIEHIMPQTMTAKWQSALGDNWQSDHDRYLHTLGNLTLTGYNPEYSNRSFREKRDMEGGFKNSPLRLNRGLAELDQWYARPIENRANVFAEQAVKIWARPDLGDDVLSIFRTQSVDSNRFDWSSAHAILEAIPEGRWTSYNNLAEAVGTGAQAMAGHLAKCTTCTHPHRVLTWKGTIAHDFHWSNSDDHRDPAEILQSEGVVIVGGRASAEQQLSREELLALIEEEEL